MAFDVVVAGGRVLDPGAGIAGSMDVGIRDGRITAVGPGLADKGAGRVIEAAQTLVLPGLVDLHTHVYWGSTYYGLSVGALAGHAGVTTWVDAGSAGAYNLPGLKAFIHDRESVRIRAFINISCLGLTSPVREVGLPEFCDVSACVKVASQYPGFVVGVKVRASAKPTGGMGVRPVELALQAADELGLPLMVHIGNSPPRLTDVLPLLRPGDILTHCFTGHGMSILDGDGRVREGAAQARARGVLFDVGHGSGSFSFPVATGATRTAFWPDVISSDAHLFSVDSGMGDLATCMSKFLALGMPMERVIEAVTAAPARVLGLEGEIGTLREGARGDLTLATLEHGSFTFRDIDGSRLDGTERFHIQRTLVGGRALEDRREWPAPPWAPRPIANPGDRD